MIHCCHPVVVCAHAYAPEVAIFVFFFLKMILNSNCFHILRFFLTYIWSACVYMLGQVMSRNIIDRSPIPLVNSSSVDACARACLISAWESNKDDLGGAACMLNSDGISTRRQ